jgi:cobalt/nickel transport system permease protein
MTHLHIPDGVLPWDVWIPGLAIAFLLLVVSARSLRGVSRQSVAYRSALGALVIAVMSVEIPPPLEFHLTLLGPVGVLLGPAGVFQVAFVASAILALVGHGGLTVVGLNTLVLGAGAALARPVFVRLARRLTVAGAMATATAVTQAVSVALWFAVVGLGLRFGGTGFARLGLLTAFALAMGVVGVVVESLVAFGIAHFIARVRPDLFPAPEAP